MKKCNDKTAIYDKSDSLNLRKINEIIWTHNETEVAEADTWQSQTQTRPTRYRAAARRGKTGTIEWANVNTARQRGGPTINGINHEDTLSVSGAAFVSLFFLRTLKADKTAQICDHVIRAGDQITRHASNTTQYIVVCSVSRHNALKKRKTWNDTNLRAKFNMPKR